MKEIDVKERFIELRAKGYSFDKISKELGKAKQTLINWNAELKEVIDNLKSERLEELYTIHNLNRENRIETFGELLFKIKDELTRRDLSDVPTDKLLDLYLKYERQTKEDMTEPVFFSEKQIENIKNPMQWAL